jgi:undecaprenyl-diphosphatase
MLSASWVGGTFPLFGVLVLTMALLAWKGKGSHIPLPLLLGVAAVLVPVLKELVNRPRPSVDLVHVYVKVVGDSFPSGHAFMSASILGGVFLLADELLEARWAVRLLRSLLVALVMAIGASRVYLGVHWASDVIGGFLLGLLALAAVARFHEGRLARRSAEGEGTEAAARAPTTA